jgi:hypothetical protein
VADRTVHVNVGGGGDYDSLNHALTDEATNLVSTLDGILHIHCEGSTADTTAAGTGVGYTVDSNHYIHVVGDYAVTSGAHYSTSYYRLETTDAQSFVALEDYTRIEKLQVKITSSSSSNMHAIYYNQVMGSVSRCVVHHDLSGTAGGSAITLYGGAGDTFYTHNCVVFGTRLAAAYGYRQIVGGVHYLYNCTISANGVGVRGATTDLTITNCAIFDNGDDINATVGTISYSAGDDAEFDSGTGNVGLDNTSGTWDDHFTDYANKNFHLISSSSFIGAGTDLGSPYDVDIDGTTRSGAWDIGADEYTLNATATSVVKAPTTTGACTISVVQAGASATATSVVKAPTTTATARKTKSTTATSVVKAPVTAAVARKTKRSTATSVVKVPTTAGVARKAKRTSTTSTVKAPITTASGTITPAVVAGTVTAIATSIVKAPATLALCRLVRRCTATSTVKAPITSGNVRRNKRCTATSVVKAPITTGSATVSSPGSAPCSGTSVVAAPRTIASCRIARHCVGTSVVNAPRTTGSVNGTVGTQLDRIEQLLYVLMAVKS